MCVCVCERRVVMCEREKRHTTCGYLEGVSESVGEDGTRWRKDEGGM